MKTLRKLLKGLKGEIDPEKIENYYGHGSHNHGSEGYSHNNSQKDYQYNQYKCPMNCEEDKTYDAPGNCPVCNMNLKIVGENQANNWLKIVLYYQEKLKNN